MVSSNFLSISNVTQVIRDFFYAENSPLRGKIWRILGDFDPFRTEVINGTPKGTSFAANTSFEPSLTFVGLSVRSVREPEKSEKREKKRKNGCQNVIFRVCVGALSRNRLLSFLAQYEISPS